MKRVIVVCLFVTIVSALPKPDEDDHADQSDHLSGRLPSSYYIRTNPNSQHINKKFYRVQQNREDVTSEDITSADRSSEDKTLEAEDENLYKLKNWLQMNKYQISQLLSQKKIQHNKKNRVTLEDDTSEDKTSDDVTSGNIQIQPFQRVIGLGKLKIKYYPPRHRHMKRIKRQGSYQNLDKNSFDAQVQWAKSYNTQKNSARQLRPVPGVEQIYNTQKNSARQLRPVPGVEQMYNIQKNSARQLRPVPGVEQLERDYYNQNNKLRQRSQREESYKNGQQNLDCVGCYDRS
ncbi:hypothetical protein O0L34_g18794 [Tuta absoluta]|nr:hypothetical protein O0L34_g18794 [Tuta absoluta]